MDKNKEDKNNLSTIQEEKNLNKNSESVLILFIIGFKYEMQ